MSYPIERTCREKEGNASTILVRDVITGIEIDIFGEGYQDDLIFSESQALAIMEALQERFDRDE